MNRAAATDTIAAIATATGSAGIGIVRISGPNAFSIAARLVGNALLRQPSHQLRHMLVHDPESGEVLDEALIAVFRAPRSLTGEDVVEVQGHGGSVTLGRVLSATLAADARAARPGEFLERAFAAGKMDLAQAEAIADQIQAETVAAQRAARRQAAGELSERVRQAASFLQEALAQIEASIDFPEDVGEIVPENLDKSLQAAAEMVHSLLATAQYGRRLREGVNVVLVGPPNAGKSSLLNALAGAERAIVTPIPGTTRDVISESLNLNGLPVRALDTAGLRQSDDPVEKIGVERARQAITDADVVVLVLPADEPDSTILLPDFSGALVVAVSKSDIAAPAAAQNAARQIFGGATCVVATAAPHGEGIVPLTEAIVAAATGGSVGLSNETDAPLVTSARHEAALRRAEQAIADARQTLSKNLPAELIAVDTHGALAALGEITGETAREDIIAGIFSRFCIGK